MIKGADKLQPDPLPWVLVQRQVQWRRHRFVAEALAAAVAEAMGPDVGYDYRPRDMILRAHRPNGAWEEVVGVDLATALARAQRHEEEFCRIEQLPFAGVDWLQAIYMGRLRESA